MGYGVKAWSHRNDDGCTGNLAIELWSDSIDNNSVIMYADLMFCDDLATIYIVDLIGCDFSEFSSRFGKPFDRLEKDDDVLFKEAKSVLLRQHTAFRNVEMDRRVRASPSPILLAIKRAVPTRINFASVLESVVGSAQSGNMFVREAHVDLSMIECM